MEPWNDSILESLCRYIGQTVTIFTTSGGLSGSGFTGVLLCADCNCVRLLCDVGAPPACPIGSACSGCMPSYGNSNGCNNSCNNSCNNACNNPCNNPFGAIAVIPTCAIACFTHNAI